MPVFAEYNFSDEGSSALDDAGGNGFQDGIYLNGAFSSEDLAFFDGEDDFVKIYSDPSFQLDGGTLDIKFVTLGPPEGETVTVVSRDYETDTPGSFRIDLLADGSIQVIHGGPDGPVVTTTDPGFFTTTDFCTVTYSWDDAEEGRLVIENVNTGETFEATVPAGLTMDMGAENPPWIVGASSEDMPVGTRDGTDQNLHGKVDYFTISDTLDNLPDDGDDNEDPVTDDDSATTDEDTPVEIDVLENDSDPDGDPLTVEGGSSTNGTVTVTTGGTLLYTPDPDFNGTDTITYTVTDGNGGSSTGTVTVTVNPVNDAPVANDDTGTTSVGTPVTIAVVANDTDVDGDPLSLLGTPTSADGTVVVNDDGTITFTPTPGFIGEAVIDYTVTDGNGGTDTAVVRVTVTEDGGGPTRDGIVRGTAGDDLINAAYTGDNDGDFIDAEDAILSGDAPNDDVVVAGDGNDTVVAGLGDDEVYGGAGDDQLDGGEGNDSMEGEDGNDSLLGGAGNDVLGGGAGDDRLSGDAGEDILYGDGGNDTLIGGEGPDSLYGGADRDVLEAGDGDEVYGGSAGDDFDTLVIRGLGEEGDGFRFAGLATDSDGNGFDGFVEVLDRTTGEVTGGFSFENIENFEVIPCFTPGTLIATPKGEVPVESLRPGDKVITRDNGIQEIAWTGAKGMDWQALTANPHLKPVLIRQGSLGNGLPERDMMVSPNHRVLVANDRTALYFDEHEVLVAAKHLVTGKGVHEVECLGTTYIHFMFDQHQVVLSNGAWTESFQPGDYTLQGMGNAQRNEIFELFPDLRTEEGLGNYAAARRTLKKHEARLLVVR